MSKLALNANKLPIGRFPSKRCVTTFQNNLFLTCQRLNIWLFSYHFALLSVLQKWLLCQPTLFTKNPPNIGNIAAVEKQHYEMPEFVGLKTIVILDTKCMNIDAVSVFGPAF